MDNTSLHIKGLTKYFFIEKGKKYGKVAGLNNLSLTLNNKEITALIGSNGSGKTTLFNIINGLLTPHSGKIIFYNGEKHDLTKLSPWQISRIGLGRMFQDDHIWENLTVMENLIAGDENTYGENPIEAIFNRKRIKETEKTKKHEATQLLQRFFRDDKKFWAIDPCKRLASGLSGGQQKIVGLLRLMMGDYKLVLIDEPTASIDKAKIGIITEIIKEMQLSGISVFVSSHDFSFVKQVADKCLFLEEGIIKVQGTPVEVLENRIVKESLTGEDNNFKIKKGQSNLNSRDLILSIKNLSAGYRKDDNIIEHIDFDIKEGETIAIVGKNGSGKSTLVKAIISSLPRKIEGEIYFNDKNISQLTTNDIVKNGIGYFAQGGQVFTSLTCNENLKFAGRSLSKKDFQARIRELALNIPLLGSKISMKHNAGTLSGGQRHQLALAMILMLKPKLLLLDEISSGLDIKAQETIFKLLADIKQKENLSFLIIEHNLALAFSFADKVYYMENKNISQADNAEKLYTGYVS